VANNYFQFKQFVVYQESCAMKVCTDACIFGAYISGLINNRLPTTNNILDIGAGTGLLSLMTAQQTHAKIDAIEIDAAAFQQAMINVNQAPWKDRISIFNGDVLQFQPGQQYDFILSNPPFFEGDLKSGNQKKDAAKHDTTLTLEQLLQAIKKHLSPHGSFGVLLPYHRSAYFIDIAEKANYLLNNQLLVQHTKTHPFFRAILVFSQTKSIVENRELSIKNETRNYTQEFIQLMQPYYLHL
jgi:tRNA1Val (adenine37-N6)-methyltransferase